MGHDKHNRCGDCHHKRKHCKCNYKSSCGDGDYSGRYTWRDHESKYCGDCHRKWKRCKCQGGHGKGKDCGCGCGGRGDCKKEMTVGTFCDNLVNIQGYVFARNRAANTLNAGGWHFQ